jgi:hypothetical protein
MNQPTERYEAVLAIAGQPAAHGSTYTPEALRAAADGVTKFYDEATGRLIYRGPLPPHQTSK